MNWGDASILAWRSVRRRPARAVLTVLAVALAAALLSALLTIAGTAKTKVLDQLAKGGPLSGVKVAAAAPDPTQVGQDDPPAGARRAIDQATIDRFRTLPGVRKVLPVVRANVFVVATGRAATGPAFEPYGTAMTGVDLARPGLLPISVLAGRIPGARSSAEVAVSEGFLRRIGVARERADQVLGTEVELAAPQRAPRHGSGRDQAEVVRSRFTRALVVGVVAQDAGGGDLLVPIAVAARARAWTAAGVDGGASFDASRSPFGGAFVVADGIADVGKVRDAITAVGYSTSAPENLLASVERYVHVVELVLAAVGIIALVVSTLGIANAMLAAVRERRREIGILKAVGARDRDIARLFVVEASVLGLVGGLIGTALGYGVAEIVAAVVNRYLVSQGLVAVDIHVAPAVMVGTVVGATVLATVGGAIPARRAARLPAREAVGAL